MSTVTVPSYVPAPTKRSNPQRIADLKAALDRWEQNLRDCRETVDEDDTSDMRTFGWGHGWKLDAELDLINEVRDLIA